MDLTNREKEVRKNYKKNEGLKEPLMVSMAEMGENGHVLINLLIDKYPIETEMVPYLETVTILSKVTGKIVRVFPEVIANHALIWDDVSEYFSLIRLKGKDNVVVFRQSVYTKKKSPVIYANKPAKLGDNIFIFMREESSDILQTIIIDKGLQAKYVAVIWENGELKVVFKEWDKEAFALLRDNWERLSPTYPVGSQWIELPRQEDQWSEHIFNVSRGECHLSEMGISGSSWREHWAVAIAPTGVLYVYLKRT